MSAGRAGRAAPGETATAGVAATLPPPGAAACATGAEASEPAVLEADEAPQATRDSSPRAHNNIR